MKKILLLCISVMCSIISFAFKGSGTESDPYQIWDADDLYMIRTSPSSCFKLMNDIDLTEWIKDNYPEAGWAPIGDSNNMFTGIFDGDGHSITNLNITRTTKNNALFGYAEGATIKNLNIKCNINGDENTAGLVAIGDNVTITSCSVEGEIKGTGTIGSIIAYGQKVILSKCSFYGRIEGVSFTGGLVGLLHRSQYKTSSASRITNCYVKGSVSATSDNVGGLIGAECGTNLYNNSFYTNIYLARISDCCFDGKVSTESSIVGGISGSGEGEYRRCAVKGSISGKKNVAGIVGKLEGYNENYKALTSNPQPYD